jgi:hypothetical protein
MESLDVILELANKEASGKDLKVFVFKEEELKKYFTVKYKEIAVVTIARNLDSAIWNLKNYKHSYLAKIK